MWKLHRNYSSHAIAMCSDEWKLTADVSYFTTLCSYAYCPHWGMLFLCSKRRKALRNWRQQIIMHNRTTIWNGQNNSTFRVYYRKIGFIGNKIPCITYQTFYKVNVDIQCWKCPKLLTRINIFNWSE